MAASPRSPCRLYEVRCAVLLLARAPRLQPVVAPELAPAAKALVDDADPEARGGFGWEPAFT